MHTIYGPGNPISLGASIEPAAIFTLRVFGLTALFSVQAFWEFFFFWLQWMKKVCLITSLRAR